MNSIIKIITLALLLGTSIASTGCTTMADAKNAKGTGQKVVYKASFDKIWGVMPEVVTEAGLEFIAANPSDHSILAQRGITALSYGENVAIFVEIVTEGDTTSVEVISKKSMKTNVFAPNWAKQIFKELDKRFNRS
ncbi:MULTISPECIES: hypothetical protein [unclassified Lentimonas]|uniref:hypothetical protein n=1 Tax=unclassified Lentimonas TaxID=2630993 RepID=UPI001326D8C3|nr:MULTISPECIES: hypothetical protein [unclassified Lentimonas]CAA6696588.1 Unannotated [Lentimonas sp. CC10]CAA6697060.1 Unannotated [Lentimonas sp. CC19]CAA7069119.1 Unannotated [Lentimonas sp. CC11]